MPESAPKSMDPARMSPADAARLLTKTGGKPVTESMLQYDVEAGAPTNADGTLNLVNFTAWLVSNVLQHIW